MKEILSYIRQQKSKIAHQYRLHKLTHAPFFKKYPYEGSFDPVLTDRQGLVDFELGVFYNRIPKAANSTIVATLATKKYGNVFEGERLAFETKSKFSIRPSKLSAGDMDKFELLYKFTFVRNPFTRVLSAYLDKIVKKRYFDIAEKRFLTKEQREQMHDTPTFTEFLDYLKNGGLYADKHWAPQHSLMLIPIPDFDHIGKIENFNDDIRPILRHLENVSVDTAVTEFRRHATNALELCSQYYDDHSQQIVADLYLQDFKYFDYSPAGPRI